MPEIRRWRDFTARCNARQLKTPSKKLVDPGLQSDPDGEANLARYTGASHQADNE
jgi:hypothetical protein